MSDYIDTTIFLNSCLLDVLAKKLSGDTYNKYLKLRNERYKLDKKLNKVLYHRDCAAKYLTLSKNERTKEKTRKAKRTIARSNRFVDRCMDLDREMENLIHETMHNDLKRRRRNINAKY